MGFRRREGGSRKVAAAVAVVVVLAAALLAACGDDDGDVATTTTSDNGAGTTTEANAGGTAEGGGGQDGGAPEWTELFFEAHPYGKITFVRNRTSTEAGKVRLQFTNPSKVRHNLAVEDSSGKKLAQTDTVTEESAFAPVELKPGKYTFYCSIPGHREAGMEGTLIVR